MQAFAAVRSHSNPQDLFPTAPDGRLKGWGGEGGGGREGWGGSEGCGGVG